MKKITLLTTLFSVFLVSSCTHFDKRKHYALTEGNGVLSPFYLSDKFVQSTFTLLNDSELQFSGSISFGDCQKLQGFISNKPSIRKLIVTSSGGLVFEGVCMGDVIHKNKIDIQVNRKCVSSCANYLFLSANQKIISEDSYVAYHGNQASSPREVCDDKKDQHLAWNECKVSKDTEKNALEEEKLLLDEIGVKQEFFDNPIVKKILKRALFVPSTRYFEEYGIKNVVGASSLKACASVGAGCAGN